MEAFVYKWVNKENGMFYIGKHKGHENDGYISSGKSFLDAYTADPDIFEREILFRGTDRECLNYEQRMIKESVRLYGYQKLYNLTAWTLLKEWKRTCKHCGAIVDPRNTEWVESFSQYHFENCKNNPVNMMIENHSAKRVVKRIAKEKVNIPLELKRVNREINRLLKDNTKENGFKHSAEIRQLRKLKSRLIILDSSPQTLFRRHEP